MNKHELEAREIKLLTEIVIRQRWIVDLMKENTRDEKELKAIEFKLLQKGKSKWIIYN